VDSRLRLLLYCNVCHNPIRLADVLFHFFKTTAYFNSPTSLFLLFIAMMLTFLDGFLAMAAEFFCPDCYMNEVASLHQWLKCYLSKEFIYPKEDGVTADDD